MLSPSTIKRDYHKVYRVIVKMPPYLESAIEIRDWLLEHYSSEVTRRLLMQFSACCKWAAESELIAGDPFKGLSKQIKKKMNSNDYRAFTATERDRIIITFQQTKPNYAPWVQFLFWTGCRPEEAAGLQWQHVSNDALTFTQAAPYDTKEVQDTKTHNSRIFPLNDRLRRLLSSVRPFPRLPFDYVFPGGELSPFEYHNFQTRHWRPLVTLLAESGAIADYLPQSHCRHTFITLALQSGMTVNDVAYLVGNSPDVIYRHYASRTRVLTVPEF